VGHADVIEARSTSGSAAQHLVHPAMIHTGLA
jgi:hypothetical protein